MDARSHDSQLSESTVTADCRGPLRLACQEIHAAVDQFTDWQRRERHLRGLIKRTDQLLDELETLNLLHVRRVPTSLRSEVADLGTELPFDHPAQLNPRPSPSAVMDFVFEIQEDLFTFTRGHALEDIQLSMAS